MTDSNMDLKHITGVDFHDNLAVDLDRLAALKELLA